MLNLSTAQTADPGDVDDPDNESSDTDDDTTTLDSHNLACEMSTSATCTNCSCNGERHGPMAAGLWHQRHPQPGGAHNTRTERLLARASQARVTARADRRAFDGPPPAGTGA